MRFLGGSRRANTEGGLPEKGAWTVCRFKRGLGKKDGGGVFHGGWHPNAHCGDINSQIREVVEAEITGKRKKGGPRKSWEEVLKKDLEQLEIKWCVCSKEMTRVN